MLPLNSAEISALKIVLDSRQPGYGLPRQFYHDELLYRAEKEYNLDRFLRWYLQEMKSTLGI